MAVCVRLHWIWTAYILQQSHHYTALNIHLSSSNKDDLQPLLQPLGDRNQPPPPIRLFQVHLSKVLLMLQTCEGSFHQSSKCQGLWSNFIWRVVTPVKGPDEMTFKYPTPTRHRSIFKVYYAARVVCTLPRSYAHIGRKTLKSIPLPAQTEQGSWERCLKKQRETPNHSVGFHERFLPFSNSKPYFHFRAS